MKKIIILIGIVFCAAISNAQHQSKQYDSTKYFIDYNFQNGKLSPIRPFTKPKVYQPVVIRINNINRAIYKITISAKDSILAQSDPQGILGQITGYTPFVLPSPHAVKQDTANHTSTDSTQATAPKTAINNAIAKSQTLSRATATNYLSNLMSSNGSNLELLSSNLINDNDNSYRYSTRIRNNPFSNATLTSEQENSKTFGKRLKQTYELVINALNDTINYCNNQMHIITTTQGILRNELLNHENSVNFLNIDSSINLLETLKSKLNNIDLVRTIANYLKTQLQQFTDDPLIDTTNKKNFKRYQAYLDTTLSKINTNEIYKQIDKTEMSLKNIRLDNFFTFVSAPFIPFGDIVTFKVIIAADTNNLTIDNRRTFELPVFTKHRFRFDFSTGLSFIGGLSNHVYLTTPYLKDASTIVSTDSLRILENPRNEKIVPVITAFIHGGFDIGHQWKPLITLGTSINTTDLDISTIVLGGGVMLGRSDRLIISSGFALKKISIIDSKFEVGKAYKKTSFANDEVAVAPQFKTGWFFSLSYNLTSKQKKE